MAADLSAAVDRLRTSSQRLNTLADAAAQLVRDTEQLLDESHVGVTASVTLWQGAYSPDADSPDWEDSLAYCRLGPGKFRLAVVRKFINPDPGEEDLVRAWHECTRDEKLDSLEKLPALILELAKQVEEKAGRAERVLFAVAPIVQSSKKRKGAQ